MSIFLLVRFVTSVTREKDKKKAFFRCVMMMMMTTTWRMLGLSARWGAFFALVRRGEGERVKSFSRCTYSCLLNTQDASVFQGKSFCRLAESSNLGRGNVRKRRRGGGGQVGREGSWNGRMRRAEGLILCSCQPCMDQEL